MKKLYTILLAFVIATVSSCTYEFPETPALIPGSANFTKVVAVGNSLTAGFMNGALYTEGQETSYANIVAQQMMANGGGVFNQPDIKSANGIILSFLPAVLGRLILKGELGPAGVENPLPTPIGAGEPLTDYAGDKAALNNFAVPGMRLVDVEFSGYDQGNPYFGRFASGLGATLLNDAIAANGSFIIFWLGNNDVLGYATSGATGNPMGDASDPTQITDMIDPDVFDTKYKTAVARLITDDSKQGIIANIPNVQDIPFFTFVGWDAIEFDPDDVASQPTIDALNAAFTGLNDVLDALKDPSFGLDPADLDSRKVAYALGSNPVLMQDDKLVDLGPFYDILDGAGAITPEERAGLEPYRQSRPMTSSDLVTLLAGSVLGTLLDPPGDDPTLVIGVSIPLGEQYTLIEADQVAIADRIVAFNATIKSVADGSGGSIALIDMNEVFAEFSQFGAEINGSGMDASILPPLGAFSLDGVHPNPRGAAYVASLFIDKINEAFGSNIPNVNPNNYPGNELPQPQ